MKTIQSFNQEVSKLKQALNGVSHIEPVLYTLTEIFVHLMCEIFATETVGQGGDDSVLTRANWTYQTAFAFKKASQIMSLNCTFETMGRQDGVLQTFDLDSQKMKVVLVAEWEWDKRTVFGEGKELEKLWKNTSNSKEVNALLFTYCLETEYYDFVKSVATYWQEKCRGRTKNYPILYLATVILKFDQKMTVPYVDSLNTVEIHAEGVKVWSYPLFCRAPYKG